MKVMVVHNRYRSAAPSGENRVVDQESRLLENAGHQVAHFERESDEIDDWSVWQKASLPARVVWNPATRTALGEALRGFRPDVVHVHNTFPLLSPSVLTACRTARVPVVATLHNYKTLCASGDFYRAGQVCHRCANGSPVAALVHRCYRNSVAATTPVVVSGMVNRSAWRRLVSAYIFISASQRQLLTELRAPRERCFVKANFVPRMDTVPAVAKQPMVLYAGRLDEAKGVPLLLAAWDRYRAAAGDGGLRLCIVGGGPLAGDVERWAVGRRDVDVVGLTDRAECLRLLAQARAAILPSQWEETFGLVAVEAMAVRTPPVAPAHGSFPELITPGVDGALYRPGDPADLARVLADIDTHPDRYAGYGANAAATYERRFRPEDNAEELVRILRFAIEHPVFRSRGGR
ncbi:MAG: glycosyltransferase [Streptosporangiales bacterium]|nr:glycosyltransferase [Streptosporangiales bacterium]